MRNMIKFLAENEPLHLFELFAKTVLKDRRLYRRVRKIRLGKWIKYYDAKQIIDLYEKGYNRKEIREKTFCPYGFVREVIKDYNNGVDVLKKLGSDDK